MLSIIRTNEGDEFLSYFPDYSNLYKLLKVFLFILNFHVEIKKAKYEHMVERLQKILDFQDPREEFLIKHSKTVEERNFIRGMISNKNTSVRSLFANYDLKKLLNLVENEVVTPEETEKIKAKPVKSDVIVIKKKTIEVDSEKTKRIEDTYDEENVVGIAKKKKKKNKGVTEEFLGN